MQHIGNQLLTLRKKVGLNQKDFGSSIGLAQGYISEVEKGIKGLSLDAVLSLKEIYKVSADWLLTGVGEIYHEISHEESNKLIIQLENPSESSVTVSAPPMELSRPVRYEFNCILVDNIASAGSVSFSDIGTSKGTPTFVPNLPKRPAPYIMLAVSGRSMEPDFHDGDFVVCYELRDQSQVMADTVHIVTSSEGIYLKEVRYLNERSGDPNAGLLRLKSLNERYDNVYLDPKESNVKLYCVVTVLHMV